MPPPPREWQRGLPPRSRGRRGRCRLQRSSVQRGDLVLFDGTEIDLHSKDRFLWRKDHAVRIDSQIFDEPVFLCGIRQQHFEELRIRNRSEEHTSELQSLMRISYAVFCLKKQH